MFQAAEHAILWKFMPSDTFCLTKFGNRFIALEGVQNPTFSMRKDIFDVEVFTQKLKAAQCFAMKKYGFEKESLEVVV